MPDKSEPGTSRVPINEAPTNIVVQMGSGTPGLAAMRTAMQLAQAFSFAVEGLFIEDQQLLAAARFSFTNEVTSCGGRHRSVAPDRLAREMRVQAVALRQQMHHLARIFEISLHTNTVRDDVEHALCKASEQARFVALSQTRAINAGFTLFSLIERMPHIEGFLLVGAKARARSGPVILVLEGYEHGQHQINFAAQLAASMGVDLIIMPTGTDAALLNRLEALAAPLQNQELNVRIVATPVGHFADIPHLVRRYAGAVLITRIDSPLTGTAHRLGRLTSTLGIPLLLYR